MTSWKRAGRLRHWFAAAWGAVAYLCGLPPSLRLLGAGGRRLFLPLSARWRDRR
jgi:hypothetical protein